MKKTTKPTWAWVALSMLASCTPSVFGQTNQNVVVSDVKAPPAMVPGAGLINDWLRGQSTAFNPWDLGGQFRMRYEDHETAGFVPNRDFTKNLPNSNDDLLLREKIHVGFMPVDWLAFYVEAMDATSHADDRHPSPDANNFDLHQAFVSVGNVNEFPLSLKVGRQEMTYGDERFVGVADWSNVGRSFDAVKLRFENDLFWVDAFVSRVVVPYDDHLDVANDYDVFSGVYASSRKLIPWQDTDLFFLVRNAGAQAPNSSALGVPGSPTSARDVYAYGARAKSLPGQLAGWDYSAEVAGEFGSVNQSGVRRELEAMAADATFGYTWTKVAGTPRLGLGFTYASGDSNPNDGKDTTFEPLFGTNHKFYGVMDLWGLRNIYSGRIAASVKPIKKLTLSMEYHLIWLADTADFFYPESGSGRSGNGYGRNPSYDSFVGSELDLLATYPVTPYAELQFGYGHFFVGKYIEQSVDAVPANGGSQDADWFYAQIKFNF